MRVAAPLIAMLALTACGSGFANQTRRAPSDTFVVADTAEPDIDTDTHDVDTGDDTDPDTSPSSDTLACYLGPLRSGDECLPTVSPSSLPATYDYPPAYNGSAQYREPQRFLDLNAVAASTPIAPNFLLSEVAQVSKGRWAVVQPHAIASLQTVRDDLGALRVNSGYRSPTYNTDVGGVTSSRHQYGDAFDLGPLNATLVQLADSCEANGAAYVGVYTGHIHCDWRNYPVDPVFYGSGRRSWSAVLPELNAIVLWQAGSLVAPAAGWDEGEPLREWTALDAHGAVIEQVTAERYTPPAHAAAVRVWVGRRLIRQIAL